MKRRCNRCSPKARRPASKRAAFPTTVSCNSIYFRDPNGYVIELTAKMAGHDSAMDRTRNGARSKLDRWQAAKNAA